MQVAELAAAGQPLGQHLEVEHVMRCGRRFPGLVGNDDQRMFVGTVVASFLVERFRLFDVHQAIFDQPAEDAGEGQRTIDF